MDTQLKTANFDQILTDIQNLDTDLILLLTDHRVWGQYHKALPIHKIREGKRVIVWKSADGEKTKNLEEYKNCVEFLLEKGIHRQAHLVALGGGALSDFAGFTAATLLRGLAWSIVPTTLLSMIDAAIGGKVALNSDQAKNSIGAFYAPCNVWNNPDFLKTLPIREIHSGKGEMAKYALLNRDIYQFIDRQEPLEELISHCANYKFQIALNDFRDSGERTLLNFGHTFGHALEKIYNLPHGIAVFWGMALVLKIFNGESSLKNLKQVQYKLELPQEPSPWLNRTFPIDKIVSLLKKDKKRRPASSIEMITLPELGKPKICQYRLDELETILQQKSDLLKKFTI